MNVPVTRHSVIPDAGSADAEARRRAYASIVEAHWTPVCKAVGFVPAWLVTLGERPECFWKIMLPGGAVGLIVGYATYTYRADPARRHQSV